MKVQQARWSRWFACSLCEQEYHGVVGCALGWACWKTYVGRPEADEIRGSAMGMLGNRLSDAKYYKDALSVQEADLSTMRRLGASETDILIAQGNLAITYTALGRDESALQMKRDVYSGSLKLHGEEHENYLMAAINYASALHDLKQDHEEAKSMMRKTIPVARRAFGDGHEVTLKMRWIYARALCEAAGALLADLHEAVATLEDAERIARRVFGSTHPIAVGLEHQLQNVRAWLARKTPSPGSV